MKNIKCPKCHKKIDMLVDICPYCDEMIFHDVIESDQPIENKEDKLDKVKKVIKNKKSKFNFLSKIKKLKIVKKNKRLFKKKLAKISKKIKKSKIYPYLTYQNILCVITVFATFAMVTMGIKIAKFTDNSSTVSKVDSKTTYVQVEKMQKDEDVEKRLDLKRGLIIMIYKNQKYAGIKSTVIYEVVPKTKKVNQTIITFPYKKNDVKNMRRYLEVNYGYAKKQEDGTLLYVDDEYRYTFTNGTSAEDDESTTSTERVEIVPLNVE